MKERTKQRLAAFRGRRCRTIVCALLLVACGYVQADAVDDLVAAKMQASRIPGLQLAIVKDDKLVKAASYGIANLQDSVAVDDDTVFTINSMTKGFTGVAVMQLVEQGKLDPADPIGDYLPELPQAWRPITVRQLLSHTSGLPDIMGEAGYFIPVAGADAAWERIQQQPMQFAANTEFRYSQTNYLLLGKLIDAVSGQPFTQFIVEQQLRKAGMPRTEAAGFAHFQGVVPRQARGYTRDVTGELTTVYSEFPPYLRAAAGMSSSATELARWLLALQAGELFSQAGSLQTLWTPARLADGRTAGFDRQLNGYAMGWQVIDRPGHPAVALVGGNRAAMIVYPQDGLAVVVLTNLMGASPETFIDAIAGHYIAGMQSINGIAVPADVLDDYVGDYAFANFSIAVSVEAGVLTLLASGEGQEKFPVFAETDSEFFAKVIDARFSFQRGEDGQVNGLVFRQGDKDMQAGKVR